MKKNYHKSIKFLIIISLILCVENLNASSPIINKIIDQFKDYLGDTIQIVNPQRLTLDEMPEYPGGQDLMMLFLNRNIKYPVIATEMGITGRVVVQFVIHKSGKVQNVKILRGIGGGCDEEAIRVIKLMPDWKPGIYKDEVVSVLYTLPIVFSLKGENPKKLKSGYQEFSKPEVFLAIRQMPKYPGGKDAMMKFISNNLKIVNRNTCPHTKVLVRFIVTNEGKIIDPEIISSPCPEVDQQVIQLINSFPDWKPGVTKGKAVDVYVTVPIDIE